MEQKQNPMENGISINKDAQIRVVVSNNRTMPNNADVIDLVRVFRRMKLKARLYAWVLVFCLLLGVSAPLLMYQFSKGMLTVSSVVTLRYSDRLVAPVKNAAGEEVPLDLDLITSSYVLNNALDGLELSQPITVANLRSNISVQKILTEETRQQQEIAATMQEDKSTQLYQQLQNIDLQYENSFIVSLTNGFGDADAKTKLELTDAELKLVLDRVLSAYNDYLVLTYADLKLPDDQISVINLDELDVLESLEQMRTALNELEDYCDEKSAAIRAYRSSSTGLSLNDLMDTLAEVKEVNVDYLYSYVYTNILVKDRDALITRYQYQLRNAQTKLDSLNENIATTQEILDSYKNDEIFVSMQESDSSKSTSTTTDYYNKLVLQQTENYTAAAEQQVTINELTEKLEKLNQSVSASSLEEVQTELEKALQACKKIYTMIHDHMQEVMESTAYNLYTEHSAPYGKQAGFLQASGKNMLLGAVLGAFVAFGVWFMAALIPEFSRKREDENKEAERV